MMLSPRMPLTTARSARTFGKWFVETVLGRFDDANNSVAASEFFSAGHRTKALRKSSNGGLRKGTRLC